MTEVDPNPMSRNDDRHSHIGIRLQYRSHDDSKWEYLEAMEWNAVGFNFYHADAMPGPELQLRRGLRRFTGTIAWQSLNTSDDAVLATVVNRLLYVRAKAVTDNPQLQMRLIKLLRVPGMVAEKTKVLASLGAAQSDAKMAELVAQRKQEHPMYHYGVKVQSEAWSAIVESALSVSSVLVSLDKWSGALGGKR
ncbi:MAG: hypothetical protein V4627_17440 [Pseudomonadota bacterium]